MSSDETIAAVKAEVLTDIQAKIDAANANPSCIVLNNYLPADVAADVLLDNPTMSSHSAALQAAYDANNAPNKTLVLFGNFNMSKLTGYRPDRYGQDNQAVPSVPVLKRHGAQPCFMAEMDNNTIDFTGAVFTIDKLFQDGMHIAGYKGNNTLKGGRWFTKRILDIDPDKKSATDWKGALGSKGKGNDWLAPIDGITGFSFKGNGTAGFNSANFSTYDLSFARNNSIDTRRVPAGQTSGGYGGRFPQIDGSTATTWGEWNGFIGNRSAALVIFQIPDVSENKRVLARLAVENIYVRGFIGSGIDVGLLGLPNGDSQPRIPTDTTQQYVPHNVDLINSVVEDCYTGGIQLHRYVDLREIGSIIRRMGHPDWSINHGGSGIGIDPGYGSASGRFSPQIRRRILNCTYVDCARKGIDAHHGTDTIVSGCYIKAGQFGMQVAFEENQTDRTEASSFGLDLGRYVVENCEIHAGSEALSFINGALSSLTNKNGDGTRAWPMRVDVQVHQVLLAAPHAWMDNYGRGGMSLNNVTCVFDAPYGERIGYNTDKYRAFWFGSGFPDRQGISSDYTLNNCRVMNSPMGNFATGFFAESIGIMNMWNCVVDVTPYSYDKLRNAAAAFTTTNQLIRGGYTTTAFSITKVPKVASVLGCGAFNQLTDKYTEFTYAVPGGNAVENVTGGGKRTPATVSIPAEAQTSVIFDFAGITEDNIFDTAKKVPIELRSTHTLSSPSMVQTAKQPRTVESRLVSESLNIGTRPVVEGVWLNGKTGNTTVIMPVKIISFGSGKTGFICVASNEDNTAGVGGITATDVSDDNTKFTLSRSSGVTVNGAAITTTTQFNKGEWIILTLTMAMTGRDLTLLGRYDGNGVTAGFVGQGLAIYPNRRVDAATIQARVNELKTLYEIA